MSSILVGLDLSPSSRAALRWAAQQARVTGRRLLAINAVSVPPSLASLGIIGNPCRPWRRASMYHSGRPTLLFGNQCGRSSGLWSSYWTIPDPHWSAAPTMRRCWLSVRMNMLGLLGWSRVPSVAIA
jgi:hypothetical protein